MDNFDFERCVRLRPKLAKGLENSDADDETCELIDKIQKLIDERRIYLVDQDSMIERRADFVQPYQKNKILISHPR